MDERVLDSKYIKGAVDTVCVALVADEADGSPNRSDPPRPRGQRAIPTDAAIGMGGGHFACRENSALVTLILAPISTKGTYQ